MVTLGEVAAFVRGISFKPEDVASLDTPGSVACMRTKNVQASLDTSDVWAVAASFVRRDEQFLRLGDVLVSSANSWNLVGKCCWVPDLPWRTSFGGFITTLRATSRRVDSRYLYWRFASERTQALVRSFGQKTTNISNLNLERCLALQLPLPALADQQRIAEILDRTDALRAKRRETMICTTRLAESVFMDLFGDPNTNLCAWPVANVGEVSEQVTDGEHQTPRRAARGVKLLSARNVRDGFIDFTDVDYVGDDEYERIRRRCDPTVGDILVSCSGTIGRVAMVEVSERLSLVRSVALIRPKSSVVRSKFLAYYLRTPALKSRMLRRANASSQANLFQGQIRALPVYLPPVALQDQFGDRIKAVEMLAERQDTSLTEMDALLPSLQRRAFCGEL